MEPLLPDNYKLTVTRQKKFNVTCQLLKFSYSASKGAILLRVRSDIGDRLKLWISCNSKKEYQNIVEDLEYYDYWRFRCYSNGQILRRYDLRERFSDRIYEDYFMIKALQLITLPKNNRSLMNQEM